jgi:hypothetical protein
MGTLQTSMYDLEETKVTEDCDHGHCVGMQINNGDGPSLVWMFVDSEEQAAALKAILGAVKRVQLVNYV